jgi:hypothetical protein
MFNDLFRSIETIILSFCVCYFQEPIENNDDDDDDELEIDDPELESLVCYPFKGGKTAVKHYHIFCLVLLRVDDVAPLIRTKSLNILADVLATQHDNSPLKHVKFCAP